MQCEFVFCLFVIAQLEIENSVQFFVRCFSFLVWALDIYGVIWIIADPVELTYFKPQLDPLTLSRYHFHILVFADPFKPSFFFLYILYIRAKMQNKRKRERVRSEYEWDNTHASMSSYRKMWYNFWINFPLTVAFFSYSLIFGIWIKTKKKKNYAKPKDNERTGGERVNEKASSLLSSFGGMFCIL